MRNPKAAVRQINATCVTKSHLSGEKNGNHSASSPFVPASVRNTVDCSDKKAKLRRLFSLAAKNIPSSNKLDAMVVVELKEINLEAESERIALKSRTSIDTVSIVGV